MLIKASLLRSYIRTGTGLKEYQWQDKGACSSASSSFSLLEAAGSTFSGGAGTLSGGYWRLGAEATKL